MSVGLLTGLWLVTVLLVWATVTYNRFVALRNGHRTAFAQIDVQIQKRHELIPSLLGAVRAGLSQERETLQWVAAARQRASDARMAAIQEPCHPFLLRQLDAADLDLNRSMADLLAVLAADPKLQGDGSVAELIATLTGTESRIGSARQAFNEAVSDYNTAVAQFPASVVATLCGFRSAPWLRAPVGAPERVPMAVAL